MSAAKLHKKFQEIISEINSFCSLDYKMITSDHDKRLKKNYKWLNELKKTFILSTVQREVLHFNYIKSHLTLETKSLITVLIFLYK